MTATPDEARAREIVGALFEGIRDRRLLKWLFPTPDEYDPEVYIGHPDIKPIEPDVQQEIRDAWIAILLPALREARDEGARAGLDWEIPCDVRVAPLTVVAHGNTLATLIRAIKDRGDMIAQGIAAPDLSAQPPALAPPLEPAAAPTLSKTLAAIRAVPPAGGWPALIDGVRQDREIDRLREDVVEAAMAMHAATNASVFDFNTRCHELNQACAALSSAQGSTTEDRN